MDGPSSPTLRAATSLQAAATLNAGLQLEEPSRRSSSSSQSRHRQSPSTGRRRSQVMMNLQIADPSVPGPGEMVSENQGSGLRGMSPHFSASPQPLYAGEPRHFRAPSLGELHQELENEQEFRVNRLLTEIQRLQLQVRQQQGGLSGSAIGDESTPPSANPTSGSLPRSPVFPTHARGSFDMARGDLLRRSRTPSRGASPRLRTTSFGGDIGEQLLLGGRDENAYYQAETQTLIRENQMLRHRIRDLEKQLGEATGAAGNASITHEPSLPSHLTHSTSVSEEDASRPGQLPTVVDDGKED